MSRRRWAVASFVLLLACGCAKAPPRTEPQASLTPPERWSSDRSSENDTVSDDWWMSFNDPFLPRIIELALEGNRDLAIAAARLEQAQAQATIAGADLKPSLGIAVDATRQKQNFIGFPFGGGGVPLTTFSRFGASVQSSWELDLWGRLRAGTQAALAEAHAGEADLHAARQSIAAQTAKVWFAILEARQQLDLARDSVESFKQSVSQVEARYASGTRPPLDLRLARSNLAAAQALDLRREQQLDQATRQLDLLLGQYPDGSAAGLDSARQLPAPPPAIPVGLPSELIGRRPDLIAAERRLAASDARYRQARRSLYPRLSLTAAGGSSSDSLGDLLDGDFGVWNLAANLTQPLFQGGRLRAGVRLAEAVGDETAASYVAQALRAYSEVETALAAESLLAREVQHLGSAAHELKAARELAERRYRRGVGEYLVVLESQSRALVAEAEWLALRRRQLENRIDLHLALGGGFEKGLAE